MTHDVQPPSYLGRDRELLAAPRLDNLLSVHAATAALAVVASAQGAAELPYIPVIAAFDHEENGSESDTGAQGPLLGNVLERSVFARGGSLEDRARALAGTICLSSDMGHAVHPNYSERHEPGHHPLPNGGPILKVNVNNRYATNGVGRAVFAAACERAGVPWQSFVSNNSMPCGTTIGPITAARLGIATVDCGIAALSMHSARELCGADDPYLLAAALKAFLEG
jgi:aspartyl aminopeptidase